MASADEDDGEGVGASSSDDGDSRGRAAAGPAASLADLCRAVLPDLLSRFLNTDLSGITPSGPMPPPVRGWRTIAERCLVDAAHAPAFRAFATDPEELGSALHARHPAATPPSEGTCGEGTGRHERALERRAKAVHAGHRQETAKVPPSAGPWHAACPRAGDAGRTENCSTDVSDPQRP
mmetsp:Transcript_20833/g.66451  ORF Transcript_20833/g.66451 Transcript_20833/m.66451 type:complete len:179 (+) Transcript_20833:492-1028(+)